MDTPFLHSDEWRHVQTSYARPGVAQACLLLQDRLGVDVLVLLHLTYVCGQHPQSLNEGQIAAADAVVRDWRDQVVRPLRAARRAIPKDDPRTQALRDAVQQAELGAEQHALFLLAGMPLATDDTPPAADPGSPTTRVATFYAQRSGSLAELSAAEIGHAIAWLDALWARGDGKAM